MSEGQARTFQAEGTAWSLGKGHEGWSFWRAINEGDLPRDESGQMSTRKVRWGLVPMGTQGNSTSSSRSNRKPWEGFRMETGMVWFELSSKRITLTSIEMAKVERGTPEKGVLQLSRWKRACGLGWEDSSGRWEVDRCSTCLEVESTRMADGSDGAERRRSI